MDRKGGKMKAAVCYEHSKPMVVEEVELKPVGKGEVKFRLAATAICHSDIHLWRGELPEPVPHVGGHESSGYIVEVGEGVTSVKPGDPVVCSLLGSCGKCSNCIKGLPHLCEAYGPNNNVPRIKNQRGETLAQSCGTGTFAEYALVDESQVVKIPAGIPMDSAALLGCGFITGFGAVVNRARVRSFDSVAVMGIGGVGLSSIQGARIAGAYPIIAVDMLDNKLEAAKTFGATHTINLKKEDPVEAVKRINSGQGVDYVFVTVGSVAAITQGLSLLGTRGTEVIVGMPNVKDMLSLSPFDFLTGEKTITGCIMGSTRLHIDVPRIISLYQAGLIKLDEYITGRYSLEQINEAIASVEKGQALRNVIVF
jgi:S-(hydroxymethyl)glutathione dehydrogenase / alcohol dehydrogenase